MSLVMNELVRLRVILDGVIAEVKKNKPIDIGQELVEIDCYLSSIVSASDDAEQYASSASEEASNARELVLELQKKINKGETDGSDD